MHYLYPPETEVSTLLLFAMKVTLDIRRLYPGYLIWGRSLDRLALAAVLYFLRPRETLGGQS